VTILKQLHTDNKLNEGAYKHMYIIWPDWKTEH